MFICAAGDIHGALDRLYADVLAFEGTLAIRFDWVLHVGDFGIWPDLSRVDGATRRHGGAGDFPEWFSSNRAVPRRTVFIKGNHEDFVWLDSRNDAEVLPGLFYLANGQTFDLKADSASVIRVGGIGGCYGPSDYDRPGDRLQGYAKRHYTRDEVDRLSAATGIDILLTHDAPAGVRFDRHRQGAGYVSNATGLDEALARTRSKLCFFGHHHTRLDAQVHGVPCFGLNKVARRGNLVAIEMAPCSGAWQRIGEWPA